MYFLQYKTKQKSVADLNSKLIVYVGTFRRIVDVAMVTNFRLRAFIGPFFSFLPSTDNCQRLGYNQQRGRPF